MSPIRGQGPPKFCRAEECDQAVHGSGLCSTHWKRYKKGYRGKKLLQPVRQNAPQTSLDDPYVPDIPAERRSRQAKLMLMANFAVDGHAACSRCGGEFPPECYDFHHLDPEDKEFCIGTRLGRVSGKALDKCLEEAGKCEMVCANCHRIITFSESNND